MTQYKNIPQPQDQRNVSQADLLGNFNYLSVPLGTTPARPGILPVDHYASGDNSANPADGFHKQISFLDMAIAAFGANLVNGVTPSCLLQSFTASGSSSQIAFVNPGVTAQLTGNVSPVAAATGHTFWPTAPGSPTILVQWGSISQGASFPAVVNFSPIFSSAPYGIFFTTKYNGSPTAGSSFALYVDTTFTTGSHFRIAQDVGSTPYGFYWIAIGPK